VALEPGHGTAGVALVRDGQDPLGQGGVAGFLQGDEAEERADGGEAGVAGPRIVATFGLEMAEEVAEQLGAELGERHRRRRCVQHTLSLEHQKAEGRTIAGDGVRAGLALSHETLGEEQREQPREVCRGVHDGALRSRRWAARCSNSGVAVRYQ